MLKWNTLENLHQLMAFIINVRISSIYMFVRQHKITHVFFSYSLHILFAKNRLNRVSVQTLAFNYLYFDKTNLT